MSGKELLAAKLLFAEELQKLAKANVAMADATSTEIRSCVVAKAAPVRPLLADIDGIPGDCERAYEVEFNCNVPQVFVGLEFPETKMWGHEKLELWQVSSKGCLWTL